MAEKAFTATEKAPAKSTATKNLPPNPERQIVLQGSSGTAAAATSAETSAASWGFGPLKTLSGQSLGSLEHYHTDWNAADLSEVSSRSPAGQIVSEHPAGPSLVTQKIAAAKTALLVGMQPTGLKSDDVSLVIPPAWPGQRYGAFIYLQDS